MGPINAPATIITNIEVRLTPIDQVTHNILLSMMSIFPFYFPSIPNGKSMPPQIISNVIVYLAYLASNGNHDLVIIMTAAKIKRDNRNIKLRMLKFISKHTGSGICVMCENVATYIATYDFGGETRVERYCDRYVKLVQS
jgi:hypothetical protein